MTRLEQLIEKAATCGRFLNTKEEGELKQLHQEHMKALVPAVEWDGEKLREMRGLPLLTKRELIR